LTYKAEKEGKPTQEESFRILATVPGEFMSFEDVNGSVPEIANGVYGTVIANTDAVYVKSGGQSAKLCFRHQQYACGNASGRIRRLVGKI